MHETTLKSEWGALAAHPDGGMVVGIRPGGQQIVLYYFGSMHDLYHALERRELVVRKWAVSVPGNQCIHKSLGLPTSDPAEATKILEFELPSLVPIPPDQLVFGCTPTLTHDNLTEYLLHIVRLDRLDSLLKPFLDRNLEVHTVLTHPLAVIAWTLPQVAIPPSTPITLVLRSPAHIEAITCINGNIQTIRRKPIDTNDARHTVWAIREFLSQHQGSGGIDVGEGQFVLVGFEAHSQSITKQIQEASDGRSHLDPLFLAHPPVLPWEGSSPPSDGKGHLEHAAVICAGLLSAVTDSQFGCFNLLPATHQKRLAKKDRIRKYVCTGGLVAMGVLLLWFSLFTMNLRIDRVCRKMEDQMAPITGVARSVETKRRHISAIENQLSNRGLILRIIQELYRFTPQTISLSELSYTSQTDRTSISMKGQADILSNAFGYTEALRKASVLNAVQIEDAQQIPRPGGSVVEFRANGIIKADRK